MTLRPMALLAGGRGVVVGRVVRHAVDHRPREAVLLGAA